MNAQPDLEAPGFNRGESHDVAGEELLEIPVDRLARWPTDTSSRQAEARWRLLAAALGRLGFTGHDKTPGAWAATSVYTAALDSLCDAVETEGARTCLVVVALPGGRQRRTRPCYPAASRRQLLAAIDRARTSR